MKKAVVLIVLILILLGGILWIIFQPKYTSEDLYALVQKGVENMHDMQNVCIERKNQTGIVRYYYKGDKMKTLILESTDLDSSVSYGIIDLEKEKQYIVSDKDKTMIVQKATNFNTILQYDVLDRINTKGENLKRELAYIKDETIEGKDCVFVKEITYYKTEDGSYQSDSELCEDIRAYWIEKSTGFVLGGAMIKPTQTDATPEAWIKSITFNEVKDSDFELPTNYTIYDSTKEE